MGMEMVMALALVMALAMVMALDKKGEVSMRCNCQDSDGIVCGKEMTDEEERQDGMCDKCACHVHAWLCAERSNKPEYVWSNKMKDKELNLHELLQQVIILTAAMHDINCTQRKFCYNECLRDMTVKTIEKMFLDKAYNLPKHVIIHVQGGVAEVISKDYGVSVEIVDLD